MTASVRTIGLLLAVLPDEPEDVSTGSWGLRRSAVLGGLADGSWHIRGPLALNKDLTAGLGFVPGWKRW